MNLITALLALSTAQTVLAVPFVGPAIDATNTTNTAIPGQAAVAAPQSTEGGQSVDTSDGHGLTKGQKVGLGVSTALATLGLAAAGTVGAFKLYKQKNKDGVNDDDARSDYNADVQFMRG